MTDDPDFGPHREPIIDELDGYTDEEIAEIIAYLEAAGLEASDG